jgi:hypothetical protein
MMKKPLSILLLSVSLASCGGSGDGGKKTDPVLKEQSTVVKKYVSDVLKIMRDNVITKNDVDWGNLEAEVSSLSASASKINETYPAITKALELLGTNHSFLSSPSGDLAAHYSNLDCIDEFDMSEPFAENIGYLRVGKFSSSGETDIQEFADTIQKRIAQQDTASLHGWVVDLRDNTGGNMWPMIAGLGPLFNTEILGHFIDADENVVNWGYSNGSAKMAEDNLVTVDEPYVLLNPLAKIAVLSSNRVASSGEATLIAFKKQSNVKIFGTDSCGLSTSNSIYPLSDGSKLVLSTGVMADREQYKYGKRVPVDQSVDQKDVLSTAIAWLKQ